MEKQTKLFISFFLLYIFFIQAISWNEYSRLDLIKSIIDENRFEIDSFANNTGDRSYYNDHYYADKAPGLSFFGAHFYYLWKKIYFDVLKNPFPIEIEYYTNKIIKNNSVETKTYEPINPGIFFLSSLYFLVLFYSSLPTLLILVIIYKISRNFLVNNKKRLIIILTYGVATLSFIYATVFFSHSLSTFFIFLSFYLLFTCKLENFKNKKKIIISGLLAGLSVVTEYPTFLLSLLLFFYLVSFRKFRVILFFVISAFIGLLPLLLYNFTILGNPFKVVYAFTDPSIRTDVGANLGFTRTPNPFIIYRHLIGPYRGLLYYHPILLFSIFGFFWMWKKHKKETILILLGFIGYLIIFSMRDINFFDFGSSFGARNYLIIIPFLMLPLAYSIKKINPFILYLFLGISIFTNIIGLQNWEWKIGETYSVYIAEPYRSKINSFEVLYNPLFQHYLPLFLKNGPRVRIVESFLINKPFEIRHIMGENSPFPYVTSIPIILILILIWHKEIWRNLKRLSHSRPFKKF
jgi:hypothetical protein